MRIVSLHSPAWSWGNSDSTDRQKRLVQIQPYPDKSSSYQARYCCRYECSSSSLVWTIVIRTGQIYLVKLQSMNQQQHLPSPNKKRMQAQAFAWRVRVLSGRRDSDVPSVGGLHDRRFEEAGDRIVAVEKHSTLATCHRHDIGHGRQLRGEGVAVDRHHVCSR